MSLMIQDDQLIIQPFWAPGYTQATYTYIHVALVLYQLLYKLEASHHFQEHGTVVTDKAINPT